MNVKDTQWVEKYRPSNINNVRNQDDIKNLLKNVENTSNMPHLLFHGPAGSGKTTMALSLTKQLFPKEIYDDRVLELNASDERGINIVREKIKKFAQNAIDEYKPSFKIIILDEVDAMSDESQFALRRIIEDYAPITRFILICNYVSKIIEPIVSRCSKYRFRSINYDNMKTILLKIARNEKMKLKNELVLKKIYELTKGDMRKAITLLQRSNFISKEPITVNLIEEIYGKIPKKIYDYIFNKLNKLDYNNMLDAHKFILSQGYSSLQFLNDLVLYIIDSEYNDKQKSIILNNIAHIEYLLNRNSDQNIQLLYILSTIMETINDKKIE